MFDLSSITKPTNGKTRLFSAENVYADKGRGGMAELTETPQPEVEKIGQHWDTNFNHAIHLGQKWKVRPCIKLMPESVTTLVDTEGPGRFTHIWITVSSDWWRDLILRFYWDGEEEPSVEAPVGDFFCCGFRKPLSINALPINVNATGGMNCYFPMPFRKSARVTVENRTPYDIPGFYYAFSMDEDDVAEDEMYFHAKFRRTNPLPFQEDYLIIDGIKGRGHYVGTQLCWQQNNAGWWGEGEFKAFIDGDGEFASYVGTGTEDYFGGAWGFNGNYSAPFLGYQDLMTLGLFGEKRETNQIGNRHSMYRFHLLDPIRFKNDLKVTMQALSWCYGGHYLPLMDDLASVAYWYQSEPHAKFEPLGNRRFLEVI